MQGVRRSVSLALFSMQHPSPPEVRDEREWVLLSQLARRRGEREYRVLPLCREESGVVLLWVAALPQWVGRHGVRAPFLSMEGISLSLLLQVEKRSAGVSAVERDSSAVSNF